jgi:Na+/H+ antiporter NhaD/arsenite permease-like protein
MEGVMFFLGVLMAVAALDSAGLLRDTAAFLGAHIKSPDLIAAAIGVASAVIDNVPLVAATMGMYDTAAVPADSELWQLIAYCAGTGGSLLVIGSAAGVAFMGLEKASFGWYLRRVTPWALAGYLAGIATYVAGHGEGSGVLLAAAGAP